MESSLSLEETNKIRISLGLKPLVDDGAPADTKEKEAADNFAARKEREEAEKRTNEIVARIEKSRNKRELHRRLVGATLGEADDDDDTLKWVKKSKKREKDLAAKRLQEMDALDKMYQEEYTEKDLAGLKVSHDFEDLNEGEDRILTLKDSRILDNEEDELQNIDLAEEQKDKKRLELKTKRRDYTGYDDDEFTGAPGMKRAVLFKYDEAINGSTDATFRLGGRVALSESKTKMEMDAAPTINRSLLSIDYLKNVESSDYVQGDIDFKKPKKKKQRSTRRVPEPDVLSKDTSPTNSTTDIKMVEVDVKPVVPDLDANFIDDDELQSMLAQSRRRKVMKPRRIAPEEFAEQGFGDFSYSRARTDEEGQRNGQLDASGALTLDDTSEFVRSITYTPAPVQQNPIIVTIDTAHMREASEDKEETGEAIAEFENSAVGDEPMDYDDEADAMLRAIEEGIANQRSETMKEEVVDEIGTSSEQTFSRGMAATLQILRQQGVLAAVSDETKERERIQKEKDKWLAQHRHSFSMRDLERLRSRGQPKDQSAREYENRLREQQEARESLDLFKDYKPDVEIKYHDEFGRELTPKEAWKALSHKFHGKGSGRMKTEKLLKKIAEEKKREAMGSGDTPLSMNAAFQIRQERVGQAHMVLSVGNRGAVPQASEFLDATASISKKDKNKNKSKKKEPAKASPAPVVDMTGFTATTLPGAGPLGSNISSSAVVSALPSVPGSPGPMTKSGFTRVMGEATSASGSASPATHEERGRVQFGFGFSTKRKAGEEPDGAPPTKR
ncbi:SART-1 family-domain-containing protein [Cantharellus anzutake]|uniref:SART-1 family-domain-containing protein n=1 Tax=Cantharellus anzutake TaxID=1750568 RepID=UPI0019089964|nr:SART-1 family-domain-containing protein [Cantharellus anzutake]KAF8339589.1 SART-1 family-domain-containing protein [Cantharellus anzutake]